MLVCQWLKKFVLSSIGVTKISFRLSYYGARRKSHVLKYCCTAKITAQTDRVHWLQQRFSNGAPQRNGAPQGLARCATLAFRKFTTCFLHYSLFSGSYKIGYDDHLEVVRYPTLQLLQPYSWHKTLFLACCST